MSQSKNEEKTNYYSDVFIEALQFAAEQHRFQARKSTDTPTIPYISHLMAVAGIVMEAGGDEVQWIAALLHDAVEDVPVPVAELRARFGDEVTEIVLACSDHVPEIDGDKKRPWPERKEAYIARLADEDTRALLVSVADKIHNGESILNDLGTFGSEVWDRFNATPQQIGWYYRSVRDVAKDRLQNAYAVRRLDRLVIALDAAVAKLDRS